MSEEWTVITDPKSGLTFYHHYKTGSYQFSNPMEERYGERPEDAVKRTDLMVSADLPSLMAVLSEKQDKSLRALDKQHDSLLDETAQSDVTDQAIFTARTCVGVGCGHAHTVILTKFGMCFSFGKWQQGQLGLGSFYTQVTDRLTRELQAASEAEVTRRKFHQSLAGIQKGPLTEVGESVIPEAAPWQVLDRVRKAGQRISTKEALELQAGDPMLRITSSIFFFHQVCLLKVVVILVAEERRMTQSLYKRMVGCCEEASKNTDIPFVRIERDDPEVRRVNIFLNVAYDAGDSGDEEERAWPSLLLMKHGKVTNMFDKPRTTKNVLRFAQS